MGQQHGDRTEPIGHRIEGGIPSLPSSSLGAFADGGDRHLLDDDRIESEVAALVGRPPGDCRRALLQAVIHEDGPRAQTDTGGLESHSGRERQGVGSTRTRDQDEGGSRHRGCRGAR